MPSLLAKTFGGLSPSYYFRQLFFGAALSAFVIFIAITAGRNGQPHPSLVGLITLCTINALLYPYARFVYDSVVGFIVGDRTWFILPLLFMLLIKLMTMTLCWGFAIFIAPLGLAYLYYHHSRAEAGTEIN